MATLQTYKRAGGTKGFTAIVRVAGFKPARQAFRTRADAEAWAAELETDLRGRRERADVQGELTTISFRQVAELYLADPNTRKLSSYGQVQTLLGWWINRLGKQRMRTIGRAGIVALRNELKETRPGNAKRLDAKLSPARVNRYLAALSAAWNWAIQQGYVRQPWPQDIKLTENNTRAVTATPEELAELFAQCDAESVELGTLARFLVGTGARLGDALAVSWRDVDMSRHEVTIGGTKTGAPYRIAMLPPGIEACHRAVKVKHLSGRVLWHWRDTGHPREAWDRARKRFPGQLAGIRIHDLRHICAGLLAAAGASTVQLAAQLGHKTLVMVQRYAHLTPAHRSEAHERLTAAFNVRDGNHG
jgi:integrase